MHIFSFLTKFITHSELAPHHVVKAGKLWNYAIFSLVTQKAETFETFVFFFSLQIDDNVVTSLPSRHQLKQFIISANPTPPNIPTIHFRNPPKNQLFQSQRFTNLSTNTSITKRKSTLIWKLVSVLPFLWVGYGAGATLCNEMFAFGIIDNNENIYVCLSWQTFIRIYEQKLGIIGWKCTGIRLIVG